MTASFCRRTRGVLLLAAVAAFGVSASATSAASLRDDVHEIRDVVPFGKSDDRFGRVTEAPPDIKTPPSTPLQVRLLASKAPALDEPVMVTLQAHAFESAPKTALSIRLPEGAAVLEGSTEEIADLEAGQTHELTVVAALTKLGEQTIAGTASRTVSEDDVWGDEDALFLTVEQERGFVGHPSGENPELEATQISDALAEKPQRVKGKSPARPALPGCCIDPDPEPDLGEPVDVDVCLTFSDRGGNTTPLRDARIQVVDNDVGNDDVLTSGFTDYYNGCTSAMVHDRDRDEGGKIDVFVRLRMEHQGRYRVENLAGAVFICSTSTQNNVSSYVNLGTWQCGSGVGSDGADDIYDDAYRLRRFVEEHRAGKGDPPGDCTVQWQAGSSNGTFYSLGDSRVHLMGQDATSRDTVTHECSHRYMHVAYNGWTTVSDCPSRHQLSGTSAPSCAWSEGWTYVNVAGADGNPTYTWPNNAATLNLETPTCNSPAWQWADGPDVEGRVGGTLIDLLDPFTISFGGVTGFGSEFFDVPCFGADGESGYFDEFWQLFTSQNDDVFVVQGSMTDSFSKAWQGLGWLGGGKICIVDRQGYYCPGNGNCAAGLNSIPSFAYD